jgi:chromosomal replication initiator protein
MLRMNPGMNPRQVWQAVLGDLQVRLPAHDFKTWLKGTSLRSLEEGVAVVSVPHEFARVNVQKKFGVEISGSLKTLLGRPVEVQFQVNGAAAREGAPSRGEAAGEAEPAQPELPNGFSPGTPLNQRYTFDNFIVGSNNRMAYAACQAVSEHPAESYNPLFLYGGVGLGKTHLLHAVGNRALRRQGMQVLYVSSEQFTNDLINSIREHRTDDFRARYRSIDILLIDDIQFIAGKESTQEEFFHTFNHLHGANKQLVMTSDRPPKAILTLEDRLRSRFEWGLMTEVKLPDLETRMAILRNKAESQRVNLPDDVLDFVARKVQSNIRELEGALNRVVALAKLNGAPITLTTAGEALDEVALAHRKRQLTPAQVVGTVATYFGLEPKQLQGKTRSRDIVVPRQVAMYIMREDTGQSLAEIGSALGGRDHTTVMHGCAKMERDIESDDKLRRDVLTIRESLYNGGK